MKDTNPSVGLGRWILLPVLGATWFAIATLALAFSIIFKLLRFGLAAVVVAVIVIVLAWLLIVTPRNVAYRDSVPGTTSTRDGVTGDACAIQSTNGDILFKTENLEDTDSVDSIRYYADGNPQEKKIVDKVSPEIRFGLTCMLQTHSLPVAAGANWPGSNKPMGPIRYHLAFLEFQENGYPVEEALGGRRLAKAQLDVLLGHLRQQKRNYVIAYIHGWRHDASIGDSDVGALRVYAAHAASFLDFRCKALGRDCNAVVTAVYVGWRGARVDERGWKSFIDRNLSWIGKAPRDALSGAINLPAWITLFDRKPISERVGPAVVAGLSEISRTLGQQSRGRPAAEADRMLTIGHSLGGNMLASTLKEKLVGQIRNHAPGELMKAPFGDLIVLINPASEAANWTALQRAMRERVAFSDDNEQFSQQTENGSRFYRKEQPPIVVSLTAAFAWPATKRRLGEPEAREAVDKSGYDWATHSLFPLFKGDLRPWSEVFEDRSDRYKAKLKVLEKEKKCSDFASRWQCDWLRFKRAIAYWFSDTLRNAPFMNTDNEDTRTIGHLNPMRPPYENDPDKHVRQSPLPYGTTHELVLNNSVGHDTLYSNAASPFRSECAIVDHWLWKTKTGRGLGRLASGWDSGVTYIRRDGSLSPDSTIPNLTAVRPRPTKKGHVETQFRQYLSRSGTQSVVHANDPFWNVRAFDTVIDGHNGFVKYPLICAINQMVMDDIASKPPGAN